MLLNRAGRRDAASSRSPSPSQSFKTRTRASTPKLKADPSLSVLRPPSPRPASTTTSPKQNTKIPAPRPYSPLHHPSPSRAPTDKTNTYPGSQSPHTPPRPRLSPTRQRVPSRTQLRQASAARRLSSEGLGKDALPDEYSLARSTSPGPVAKEDMFWSGIWSTMRASEQKKDTDCRPKCRQAKRKEVEPTPVTYVKPPPYLRKTLEAAGVGLMADSASMETLLRNKDFLKASFLTPQSVLDNIVHDDIFYHVWVAAMLAMEELPIEKHDSEFEEVLKLAFTKFLIELGSAIVDCLEPGLPLYTFVDPRKIMHPEGMNAILEQAVAIVEGLEKKGVARDRIYISIPATEVGLAIAKDLKERHGIKTNLVFVSGLAQAAACAAAGAAAITMPVDSILTYHERRRGFYYAKLNPHPGRQNIKATACYMKHHKLETQIIASGLRSLHEIEHCSALDSVCLADLQVETAKWHRMRVNRPPGPSSTAMAYATRAPFPPRISEDERGFRYFSGMTPETRNEATEILQAGLKGWQDASTRIAEVLRSEMQRQVDAYKAPPPPSPPPEPQTQESPISDDDLEHWDYIHNVTIRSRSSLSSRETSDSENTLNVEFPRTERDEEFEAELEKLERRFSSGTSSVCSIAPPSPYMQDLDSFDYDEPGSSSDDSTDDMIIF